jgi:CubicO group peptidase (beta-lactamase class C family)
MVLGLALGRVTATPFAELIQQRLFGTLGLRNARCPSPLDGDDVAPGYSGPAQVPWWRTNLPGPGGVGMSIADLAVYLRAHVEPDTTPIGEAVTLATQMHTTEPSAMGLGWGHKGGGLFHDGGTGGFRSFVAFHRPTATGVALLANSAEADVVTAAGFAVLTQMARETAASG